MSAPKPLVRYDAGQPADLFSELVVKYAPGAYDGPTDPEGCAAFMSLDRDDAVLLVAEHVRGGYWLSTHAGQGEAGACHDNQVYDEEWVPKLLVDLRNGDRYQPVVMTGFKQTHVAGEPIDH